MNLAASITIVGLSYVLGRLFGINDGRKPTVEHDGRRFAYRAAIIIAVCALLWWRTDWQWWHVLTTAIASGFTMSIGIRLGHNGEKNIHRCYISAGNNYDIIALHLVTWRTFRQLRAGHQLWYNTNDFGYRSDVHRAGAMLFRFEIIMAAICLLVEIIAQQRLAQ